MSEYDTETGSVRSAAGSPSAAGMPQGGQPGALQGGQARTAWSIAAQQCGHASTNGSDRAAAELSWKEKYLALFTRSLQLEFKVGYLRCATLSSCGSNYGRQ